MTAVIQLFVYPDSWSVHIFWAASLLYLIKCGGGTISIDHLFRNKAT
jgi:putative oxidoreductase